MIQPSKAAAANSAPPSEALQRLLDESDTTAVTRTPTDASAATSSSSLNPHRGKEYEDSPLAPTAMTTTLPHDTSRQELSAQQRLKPCLVMGARKENDSLTLKAQLPQEQQGETLASIHRNYSTSGVMTTAPGLSGSGTTEHTAEQRGSNLGSHSLNKQPHCDESPLTPMQPSQSNSNEPVPPVAPHPPHTASPPMRASLVRSDPLPEDSRGNFSRSSALLGADEGEGAGRRAGGPADLARHERELVAGTSLQAGFSCSNSPPGQREKQPNFFHVSVLSANEAIAGGGTPCGSAPCPRLGGSELEGRRNRSCNTGPLSLAQTDSCDGCAVKAASSSISSQPQQEPVQALREDSDSELPDWVLPNFAGISAHRGLERGERSSSHHSIDTKNVSAAHSQQNGNGGSHGGSKTTLADSGVHVGWPSTAAAAQMPVPLYAQELRGSSPPPPQASSPQAVSASFEGRVDLSTSMCVHPDRGKSMVLDESMSMLLPKASNELDSMSTTHTIPDSQSNHEVRCTLTEAALASYSMRVRPISHLERVAAVDHFVREQREMIARRAKEEMLNFIATGSDVMRILT